MGWLSTEQLCDAFESPLPSPAGGSAAAVAGAMAASLVAMVGRGSSDWAEGLDAAASATLLRRRLLELGAEDVEAVAAVVASRRDGDDSAQADAWVWASRVPAEIAARAADVAVLAVSASENGKRPMRADAVAAVSLARAATGIAASIVAANLGSRRVPVDVARSLQDAAGDAAERAGITAGQEGAPGADD